MGSLGFSEITVILVLALIVFGPKRMPEIGRTIGKALRELRKVSQEFTSTITMDAGPDTVSDTDKEKQN